MTIQSLATEVSREFTKQVRADGHTEYWSRQSNAEDWIYELCMAAHGDMLPDDWRYEFIVQALDALAEYEDADEARDSLEPDIYTARLTDWLASNVNRAGYVDDAIEEQGGHYVSRTGEHSGVLADIALGQLAEKQEVFDQVRESLEQRLEATEGANVE